MAKATNNIVDIQPIIADPKLRELALRTVNCVNIQANERGCNFGQALWPASEVIDGSREFQAAWIAAGGPQFPEGLTRKCWMSVASQTRAWASRVSKAGEQALAAPAETEAQPEQPIVAEATPAQPEPAPAQEQLELPLDEDSPF